MDRLEREKSTQERDIGDRETKDRQRYCLVESGGLLFVYSTAKLLGEKEILPQSHRHTPIFIHPSLSRSIRL